MDETCAHILDPIPDEQYLEARDATGGKPAGVRFLAFNTIIDIEAYGEAAACRAAFEKARALCRLYERLFSRTLPHSDIARINSAHGQPVAIDPLTYDLLERALSYCAESEGAFDITVGPAVRLWNFHDGTVPDDGALAEAVRHVDWRSLKLWKAATAPAAESGADAATEAVPGFETEPEPKACFAQLADPDAAVDAGGIAKGWIADALVAAMEAHGLSGTIVNLGGNVAVMGGKPDGAPWRVGVRRPLPSSSMPLLDSFAVLALRDGSAVTSGIYERAFEQDGKLYHHILDPRTGFPAETDLLSATVVAQSSLDADGYTTALIMMGADRALAFAEQHPALEAVLVTTEGDVLATSGIGDRVLFELLG